MGRGRETRVSCGGRIGKTVGFSRGMGHTGFSHYFLVLSIYPMIEPEIKDLIERDLELNEENNKILKKMLFSSKITLILNVIKWVIIVGSILGITYWLGPRLESLVSTYRDLLR